MKSIRLASEYLVRYGDINDDGQTFVRGCFAFSQQQQTDGVGLTINLDSGREIGRAYLTANDRGVRWEHVIVDVPTYVAEVEASHFRVAWKPVIVIDETEWIDDQECIMSARIFEVSLVPLRLAYPKKEVRLMTA